MTNIQSKLIPVVCSCKQYVHPWTDSCWNSTAGLLLHATKHNFRLYSAVYLLSLLMRGRIPTPIEIKRTIHGILQSSAFLTTNAFTFVLFVCLIRNLLGKFYFLTIAYIPSFIASVCAIFVERPARRVLLTLYVANVATETVWRMAVSRGMVQSIPHGQAIIFGVSSSLLLYFYRLGLHNIYKDSLFNIIRFVVGRDEEKRIVLVDEAQPESNPAEGTESRMQDRDGRPQGRNHFRDISFLVRIYLKLLDKIKSQNRHKSCPHNNSCLYYSVRGGLKLFMVGFGLQVTLKIALQLKKLLQLKLNLRKTIFNKDTLNLGIFLGGFSFLFRSISCSLRHITGFDHPIFALPAGLAASFAFIKFPDITVALYIMWKMLQISYNIGVDKGILPRVPGFTVLLYCASTALLFHTAIVEPHNLRSSYWKFLIGISGGRVTIMDRDPFNIWGLSNKDVEEVVKLTHTRAAKIEFAYS